MRRVLALAGVVSAIALVSACSSSGEQGVTFTSWGGALQEGIEQAVAAPFEAETGIATISDGPTDYAKIKAMVESNQVLWDAVEGDPFFAIAECGVLLESIDTSIVDTSSMPPEYVSECAVPSVQVADIMLYDKEKFGANAPKGWADFFDTEKFPGKRGAWSDVYAGNLEIALLADGVKPEDLYPIDVDRALAKWDAIKDDVIFWDSGAQSQQFMSSREASILWAWSGRAYDAVLNGAEYEPVWDQNLTVFNVWMVPKGAPNAEDAMRFIQFASEKTQQEKLSKLIPYAPTNVTAKPKLDELSTQFSPIAPQNTATQISIDAAWYADNYSTAQRAWDDWRTG